MPRTSLFFAFAVLLAGTPATAQAPVSSRPSLAAACVAPAMRGGAKRYPVRLEISGDDAHALGSGTVTVSRADGSGMVTINCDRPRVLMRLQVGDYDASVDAAAAPTRNLRFHVSSGGGTLVVHFAPGKPLLTPR